MRRPGVGGKKAERRDHAARDHDGTVGITQGCPCPGLAVLCGTQGVRVKDP